MYSYRVIRIYRNKEVNLAEAELENKKKKNKKKTFNYILYASIVWLKILAGKNRFVVIIAHACVKLKGFDSFGWSNVFVTTSVNYTFV